MAQMAQRKTGFLTNKPCPCCGRGFEDNPAAMVNVRRWRVVALVLLGAAGVAILGGFVAFASHNRPSSTSAFLLLGLGIVMSVNILANISSLWRIHVEDD